MKTFEVRLRDDVPFEIKADKYEFNETSMTGTLLVEFYKKLDDIDRQKLINMGTPEDKILDQKVIMTIPGSNVIYVKLVEEG